MSYTVLVILAFGAFAFGAVYDWAYVPLLLACAATGIWGLVLQVPHARRRVNVPLLAAVLLVAAAIGFQLIPMARATIVQLSPATDSFLRQHDVGYALRALQEIRAAELPDDGRGTKAGETGIADVLTTTPVSHPLSINPRKTLLGLSFLAAFALFVLGLSRALDGGQLRTVVQGLAGIGVALALAGVIQRALWNGKVYGFWEPQNSNAQPFGPFINTNHFAGWMVMALPLVLGYFAAQVTRGMEGVGPGWRSKAAWFSTPQALRAVLLGFSALVMAFATALTFSRSGMVCLVLVVALTALNVVRGPSTGSRPTEVGRHTGVGRNILLLSILTIALVASLWWAGIGEILVQVETAGQGMQMRLGVWADAWQIHQLYPVFGTGFNTYGTASILHQTYQVGTLHFAEAHNDYLQLLAEGGYMVTVPAVILLIVFAWQVRARFRDGHDDRTGHWLRLGAVTGIVAIAVQEFFEFSLQMPGNAALFCLLCAVALRKATPKHSDSGLGARASGHVAIVLLLGSTLALSGCQAEPPANPQKQGVEAVYSKATGKLELLKHDSNKDGKPDTFSYMEGTRILRIEVDRNFDDVIDRWEYYTADGRLEKVGVSRQNDGVVDAWAFQGQDGSIARVEVSTKRDGRVNRWERMANGVLVSAEEDGNGDGRPDRWETYENGSIATLAIDTQGRGRPDRKLIYGPAGVRTEKIE